METKAIKIKVPKGYVIDEENSTFGRIVFKPKQVNTWTDIVNISGVYINERSVLLKDVFKSAECNRNVFLNKNYAKSALALAQISQLLPYYDSNVDWNNISKKKFVIIYNASLSLFCIDDYYTAKQFLAFNTQEEAERFIKHNKQLLKDYFMVD